ncbi:hypothetical protein QBC42DRAFT_288604 [Cladorrhinum samala]|uniref:Uncharacterized protein n=1 Tax=Cladorrhinum samala TaxID=585594 RepID=A0AAV9HI68_9PEZI|nr:hypothetical protein QBC42DRAFT_288604 [Cladorrhinum samala]
MLGDEEYSSEEESPVASPDLSAAWNLLGRHGLALAVPSAPLSDEDSSDEGDVPVGFPDLDARNLPGRHSAPPAFSHLSGQDDAPVVQVPRAPLGGLSEDDASVVQVPPAPLGAWNLVGSHSPAAAVPAAPSNDEEPSDGDDAPVVALSAQNLHGGHAAAPVPAPLAVENLAGGVPYPSEERSLELGRFLLREAYEQATKEKKQEYLQQAERLLSKETVGQLLREMGRDPIDDGFPRTPGVNASLHEVSRWAQMFGKCRTAKGANILLEELTDEDIWRYEDAAVLTQQFHKLCKEVERNPWEDVADGRQGPRRIVDETFVFGNVTTFHLEDWDGRKRWVREDYPGITRDILSAWRFGEGYKVWIDEEHMEGDARQFRIKDSTGFTEWVDAGHPRVTQRMVREWEESINQQWTSPMDEERDDRSQTAG